MSWAIIALGAIGVIVGSVTVGMIVIQFPLMKDMGLLALPAILVGIGVILAGVKLRAK
jgi:hypothetical protein